MSSKNNNYLFINWKDITHPQAGGAEIVLHQIMNRLIEDGHKVTLLTSKYDNTEYTLIDNIDVIRVGTNKFLHSFQALIYYNNHLKDQYDYVIECVNTVPYFTKFFNTQSKHYLFYHQLAREIWFYETSTPLSHIGYYILEPIATKIQTIGKPQVITISNSTKADLESWGFKPNHIKIVSEGIDNASIDAYLPEAKSKQFTLLFHSSLRPMKRVMDVLKAVNIVINQGYNIQLLISGGGDQQELLKYINQHTLASNIKLLGRTTDEQKLNIMQQSTSLISTSIKEGWGLIVTEANSMATPAITYNVDGLRDSNVTGIITKANNPDSLAISIVEMYDIFTNNQAKYNQMCNESLKFAKTINFDQCYQDFNTITQ
jgi:glycosyltransferase involved in cell wall biosynthesis